MNSSINEKEELATQTWEFGARQVGDIVKLVQDCSGWHELRKAYTQEQLKQDDDDDNDECKYIID